MNTGVSKHLYIILKLENTLLKTRGKYDLYIKRVNCQYIMSAAYTL